MKLSSIRNKRVLLLVIVSLALVMLALSACGGGDEPASSNNNQQNTQQNNQQDNQQSAPRNFNVKIANGSDYIFNEIYVTSTANSSWGSDVLGGTNILKSNGSYDVSVEKYDFENYDILVVDEDDDEYIFKYVTLRQGTEVTVYFDADGLYVHVLHSDGSEEYVDGEFYSSSNNDVPDPAPVVVDPLYTTGYETNGYYSFTIYNESPYDIYAVDLGLASGWVADDNDMLPYILSAGDSFTVEGPLPVDYYNETDWTLYVTDVDGDVSSSYDYCNIWGLSYVDITWDSDAYGYVCEFFY